MTREERAKDYAEHNISKYTNEFANIYNAYLKGANEETKELERENAELKEQISNLLSCKNCKENKGGYICEKEYENKCLSQKIQFIKELQEEIAELEESNKEWKIPTNEKNVEVLYQDCDKMNTYNCIYDIHAENWLYYNLDNMVLELFPFNVIAWKEIVLPKESELKQ